jgi:hypothetical protein
MKTIQISNVTAIHGIRFQDVNQRFTKGPAFLKQMKFRECRGNISGDSSEPFSHSLAIIPGFLI